MICYNFPDTAGHHYKAVKHDIAYMSTMIEAGHYQNLNSQKTLHITPLKGKLQGINLGDPEENWLHYNGITWYTYFFFTSMC